jgi:predicted nucleic acid-binding protein
MVLVLVDTNILIDAFNGVQQAVIEIASYQDCAISVINWMEASCRMSDEDLLVFEDFLDSVPVQIIHTNEDIMRETRKIQALRLGNKQKLPLPDSIVEATAKVTHRIIVTRNPTDFGGESASVRVPYDLVTETIYVSVDGVTTPARVTKTVNIRPPLAS